MQTQLWDETSKNIEPTYEPSIFYWLPGQNSVA